MAAFRYEARENFDGETAGLPACPRTHRPGRRQARHRDPKRRELIGIYLAASNRAAVLAACEAAFQQAPDSATSESVQREIRQTPAPQR